MSSAIQISLLQNLPFKVKIREYPTTIITPPVPGTVSIGTIFASNSIIVGNSTVNAIVNSTSFSGTANNSTYFSGLTLASVQSQITGNASTAYTNAVSTAASGAAVIYQTMAGLSANVATLTSNNSNYFSGQPASYYTNATNISTGTVSPERLPANLVFWSNTNVFSSAQIFNANITVNTASHIILSSASGISANNTYGNPGQGLVSNGSSVYWADNPGYTGSTGFVGSRGDTGFTGSFGFTGSKGDNGVNGFTGSFGFTGSKGDNGTNGFTGSKGDNGVNGFTGSVGFTGSKGDNGVNGFTGSIGFTGSKGDNGTNGFTGSIGFTGSASTVIGFTGSLGFTGSIGFTGSKGDNGTNGFTGSVGFTGSKGDNGTNGFTGSVGFTGSIGFTGSVGFTGSQGIQGTGGFTGSKGDNGVNGFTGSIGFTGSTGFTGSASTVAGPSGSTGFTGSTGSGFTGSKGDTGFTGSQGLQGGGEIVTSVSTNSNMSTPTTFYLASGTITLTLPTSAGNSGLKFQVKNNGSGSITIDTTSSQTIDGNINMILTEQNSVIGLISDGSNWKIF